uniref:protein-ribulosamine 3-kinase n=1 Tax=Zooxanthella nutricula TaxID=1333877 RepID=A0A7S2IIX1_9DINO
MFEGEALGLRALGAAGGVKVPTVHHFGDDGAGGSYIIMEKLNIGGRPDMQAFGRAMAQMHLADPEDPNAKKGMFGFAVDNTIGGTPQLNPWTDDWVTFFREHRIGYQVKRAGRPELTAIWSKVLDKTDGLRTLFTDGPIRPSVLHGDLWTGNYGGSPEGAAIFDPAAYYGHHEAEWGMSWCASFGEDFWEGYREVIPEAPLFRKREPLYEAYHKLNHYNLFGGGYLGDAEYLLRQLTFD